MKQKKISVSCWWEYKLIFPTWENSLAVSIKTRHKHVPWPSKSTYRCIPNRNAYTFSQKTFFVTFRALISIIPPNWILSKFPHSQILYDNANQWFTTLGRNKDKSHKYNIEWKKPVSKKTTYSMIQCIQSTGTGKVNL